MRTLSPRTVRVLLLGLGGPLMAACSAEGPSGSGQPTTLTVLYCCAGGLLTPIYNLPAQQIVFLPLTDLDDEGEPTGNLARSWEHSPDYRSWTIHLRTDVRWHDGVPVTAHDIKFTLDLLSDPEVGVMAGTAISSVAALDDTTVAVEIQASGINLLDGYTVYYPRHLLEDLDPAEISTWDFWNAPVGNGPYRYVRRVPQLMMEFEANPDYHRGRPAIDRLIVRFGDPSLTELLGGEVDAVPWVDRMDLLSVEDDARFRYYDYVGPYVAQAIAWNHRFPALADARVRRALTLALDRRELHRVLNLPDDLPIFDVIPRWRQFRRGEVPEPLPHDPELSIRLLEEAGWSDADGDGVRERDGEPVRLELLVPSIRGREQAVVFIQDQLAHVGVAAEIQVLELETGRQKVRNGDFEAAIVQIVNALGHFRGHEAYFGAQSLLGYTRPGVVALLDRAAATMIPDELDIIYDELVPIFQADLPATFLYPSVSTTIAHRRVRGLRSQVCVDPLECVEQLWIEEP